MDGAIEFETEAGMFTGTSRVVEEFRQIVFWPFAIEVAPGKKACDAVEKLAKRIRNAGDPDGVRTWHYVPDRLLHIEDDADLQIAAGGGGSPYAYQELVYFHDFVSRFLYKKSPQEGRTSASPTFHLFKLPSLTAATVTVRVKDGKSNPRRLHVSRCNLYLFRTGIGVLALEIGNKDPRSQAPSPDPMSFDEVLRLSDQFRRTYPPFFEVKPKEQKAKQDKADADGVVEADQFAYVPGGVVESLTWHFGDDKEPEYAAADLATANRRITQGYRDEDREPPIAPHWEELLPAQLRVVGGARAAGRNVQPIRHILDERMPAMTYVRVAGDGGRLAKIPRALFMRLCFVDAPGEGLPYAKEFMTDFESKHCYDRFLHWDTRHMFSPYSYAMIGSGGFFGSELLQHFRRMYFQMMLLTQVEFATYVAISGRVSRAMDEADQSPAGIRGRNFKQTILQIEEEFLDFIHRFRFTGVSNQVQAIEMFDLWRRHTRLEALFEDVKEELGGAVQYLFAKDEADQANSARVLNAIVAIGGLFGLALSSLSVSGAVAFFKSPPLKCQALADKLQVFLAALAPFATAAAFAFAIYLVWQRPKNWLHLLSGEGGRSWIPIVAGALVYIASIASFFGWKWSSHFCPGS